MIDGVHQCSKRASLRILDLPKTNTSMNVCHVIRWRSVQIWIPRVMEWRRGWGPIWAKQLTLSWPICENRVFSINLNSAGGTFLWSLSSICLSTAECSAPRYERSECSQSTKDKRFSELSLSSVTGLFYIFLVGVILSCIIAFTEFLITAKAESEKLRIDFREILRIKMIE